MTLTTRLAVAMVALVVITATAVAWLSYRNLEQALLPRVLERTESHSRLVAAELQSYVRGARRGVGSFRAAPALNGMIRAHIAGGIDPVDGIPEKKWRDRITEFLVTHLESQPTYTRFRIIGLDDGGRELVHVDRAGAGGSIRVVPDPELQRRGDTDYFKDTIQLKAGEIYVAPVVLNRESGATGARVPTLRIATPLSAADGRPFGITIVDIDMQPAFDRVRASARGGGQIYVVDRRGDYLVHPDPAREFGTESGAVIRWQSDFPDLAAPPGPEQGVAKMIRDQAGQPAGAALAPAAVAGEWAGVIETIPNAVAMAPAATIQRSSLLVGLIAIVCAGGLAWLIARSLTQPIVQLTEAVEDLGRNDSAPVPINASGETGVLARAFSRVMDEVKAKTTALEREVQHHRRTEASRDRYAERERLFSAAVESSNDAIVTKTLNGTITGWNPAAERLFGYAAAEAIGKGIDIIVPPDRLTEMHDILSRIGRGEKIEHHETMRVRKDGSPLEVSLGISPIRASSGEIVGASKTARDIGEAKRTQQALNQQIEERRRIFETSQDLILVSDSRGTLVQVSPSVETILGYLPEEMIGHSAVDFMHLDDLDDTRKQLRAARHGQHTTNFDSRYIHKDGRIVTLSWMGTWSEPVRRHFFIGRDMTQSRMAQEALLESEQLARGIVDTALDAFIQIDESGTIVDWNSQAETIFGWPREDALGKKFGALILSETDRVEIRAALQRFLGSGRDQILGRRREITARRRDGKEFRAEMSVTALKRRNGFLFNGFFRDLTEKIAAEDRIRQAEKMEAVGQLTGGIAHDFNNILTVITGTIEILADAVEDEPQLAAIARMIDEAATRGANLTQHLLAFARKQPLQPREIDVNTLIIETAKLLRPTLGEQIEIESVFEDEACLATVDPNQLATAILNLALNARDAMPDGGKLILETGSVYLDEAYSNMHNEVRPGRYALIAVSDTGTGIPAALIDKVFDPFFTSKGPGEGTGLGLSMVYGFVKQSGGHIKIYSEEGHGTTMKIYLPPGTGASVASEAAPPQIVQGGHERILVVEDDALVRNYVITQLHALGYATLAAGNAAEALAIVDAGAEFDLLFTDAIMPGTMNGRQLADAIRKHRPTLKTLFTSGYTENAIIHHGRLDPGVLLLAKPYRRSDLARMIRKALGLMEMSGVTS
jgi:PAS domain S-box-containing protein